VSHPKSPSADWPLAMLLEPRTRLANVFIVTLE
jgi:hypothetical protein